jgi:hypothetical protein
MVNRKRIYLLMFLISTIITILTTDQLQNKAIIPGFLKLKILIIGIIFLIIFLMSFLVYKVSFNHREIKTRPKIFLLEVISLLILILSLSVSGVLILNKLDNKWSIGIYSSNSNEPFCFSAHNIQNPVLTSKDVTDVPAKFVADPFLIHQNNKYYLFFEVMNEKNKKGDIGLATSNDGYNWSYNQIVLDEPFHLSYPYVFEWKGNYYMIPETGHAKSVRLYKADDFPYNWSFAKTLIEGNNFVDNSIFYYNDTWWLFTETYSDLRLYYSDNLLGPWVEHPKSPIKHGDMNISRPGGNVVVFNDRVIRYTQDDDPYYGNQVLAFEITNISKTAYEEHKISDVPVVKGEDNWNIRGMHQVSPYKMNDTWIAAVDGY